MSEFANVTVIKEANVYFDGKVTSRTITFANGSTKTLVIMQPGEYTFTTEVAVRRDFSRSARSNNPCQAARQPPDARLAQGQGGQEHGSDRDGYRGPACNLIAGRMRRRPLSRVDQKHR